MNKSNLKKDCSFPLVLFYSVMGPGRLISMASSGIQSEDHADLIIKW